MLSILIVDKMHPSITKQLEDIGLHSIYKPDIQRKEILEEIDKYQGIIIRSKTKLDKEFLDKTQNLKFIARAGSGVDLIDLEEVEKRNITILNAPEGNRTAVGEHAIGMLLNLFNRIHLAHQEVIQGIWQREENRGTEIKGKTLGIIGYGNTGKSFAKRMHAFACDILAYDKYLYQYTDDFVQEASFAEIQERCDIISFHVPLTEETREMCNIEFINNFRKPIYIINTSRGKVVKLADLLESIENNQVLGACLDVLENEKLQTFNSDEEEIFKKLIQTQKVIFTPHVAGWTHESYQKINEVLVQKIKEII